MASRNLAIFHGALFDAINGITQDYQPYRFRPAPPAGALPEAAACGAAHEILMGLYPERRGAFDKQLHDSLASLPAGDGRDAGVLHGRSVAQAMLKWRANDNASTTVPYIVRTGAGQWQRTPPQFRPPESPNWPFLTPFAIANASQFRPPGPPALSSKRYAEELNQVKELGAANSKTRTAYQTETARFWSDFSYTYTPPGHWNHIAQDICLKRKFSLGQSARLFSLLNFAMADAGLVAWDTKYVFNSWRPVTAIREADRDDNPATTPDPEWLPLLNTPPFPEYVSGHSIYSGAAAQVLSLVLGTDAAEFQATSDTLPGLKRQYHSFRECAGEIGMSRIYGGIHFLSGDLDGLAAGRSIANYVVTNLLQPVKKSGVAPNASGRAKNGKEAR